MQRSRRRHRNGRRVSLRRRAGRVDGSAARACRTSGCESRRPRTADVRCTSIRSRRGRRQPAWQPPTGMPRGRRCAPRCVQIIVLSIFAAAGADRAAQLCARGAAIAAARSSSPLRHRVLAVVRLGTRHKHVADPSIEMLALLRRPAVVGGRASVAALPRGRAVREAVLADDPGVVVAADGAQVARSAGRTRHPVRRRARPARAPHLSNAPRPASAPRLSDIAGPARSEHAAGNAHRDRARRSTTSSTRPSTPSSPSSRSSCSRSSSGARSPPSSSLLPRARRRSAA